jgi:hypothetical protein
MTKHTVVHVRLPDDVLRQYQAEAERQGMTTVDLLASVLCNYAMRDGTIAARRREKP